MTTIPAPSRITVVVPARGEERTLGGCLRSVHTARAHLDADCGAAAPSVAIVVVLDGCPSAIRRAAEDEGAATVSVAAGSLGAARAAGIDHALGSATDPPERHWIANTDADSIVPADWLSTQYSHAAAGAVVLTGPVRSGPAGPSHRTTGVGPTGDRHRDVRGANLGIRADVYGLLGGFPPVQFGEDRALVGAALAHMIPVTATEGSAVVIVRTGEPQPLPRLGARTWECAGSRAL